MGMEQPRLQIEQLHTWISSLCRLVVLPQRPSEARCVKMAHFRQVGLRFGAVELRRKDSLSPSFLIATVIPRRTAVIPRRNTVMLRFYPVSASSSDAVPAYHGRVRDNESKLRLP
jgi:hypothetical protein